MNSRLIIAAQKAACLSHMPDFRMGAALKVGKTIFSACNSFKTSASMKTPYHTYHAEMAVCFKALHFVSSLRNAELVIVRIDKRNNLKMAKPCGACSSFIAVHNINKIFFSNSAGLFERF